MADNSLRFNHTAQRFVKHGNIEDTKMYSSISKKNRITYSVGNQRCSNNRTHSEKCSIPTLTELRNQNQNFRPSKRHTRSGIHTNF